MNKMLLTLLVSTLLVACSSTPDEQPTDMGEAPTPTQIATVGATELSGSGIAALTDPSNILSRRSVYFEFDRYTVPASDAQLVAAHAKFLSENPTMQMLVQGNTDERGSREYNLSLGQKRAEALKRALMMQGATESQIESVSLGKEKPRCIDRSEACHAENRRSDMLYSGEF